MRSPHDIESTDLLDRMKAAVSLGWSLFAKKVGSGLITVNKEASMQLHLAYVLQQLLPLIEFGQGEKFEIELETAAKHGNSSCEMDILFTGSSKQVQRRIAVELKCYRTKASSGFNRGATDIFMKDVYEDLRRLEYFVQDGQAEAGIALVMNDLERLVNPKSKDAKCWDYDISHGAAFGPVKLTTPIGGKQIDIELQRKYSFEWIQHGSFWFLQAEGLV